MNTCYIFGSVEVDKFKFNIDKTDIVIAADAGMKNTEKFGLNADYIVGDFDSLNYTPTGNNIIKHPVKKNETDLILAIDIGFEKGYKNFVIAGCVGGRYDHTFASIQSAAYVTEKGGNAVLINDGTYLTIIEDTSISFPDDCKGIISVFSYTENAFGVSEKGLLYEIENKDLTQNFPLGVSNEFIGKESIISVKNGKLLVIWQTETGTYKIGGQNE